jgi:glutamate carboxypeptidase
MRFRPLGLAILLLMAPCVTRAGLTPEEQKIVAAVNQHIGEFPHDLEQAVQISSATEDLAGVRRISQLFEDQLTALGLESKFVEAPAALHRAGHLIAEHRGTKGKRLLLIGHLDTVLPGGNFRREGDRALGSGTSDIKGGDLVLIYALRALHDAGLLEGTQIIVVMTGDEEAAGRPVEISRKLLLDAAQRSDLALAFEGAIGHTGTVARRGTTSWEIEVQGATGHSAGIFSSSMGAGSVYEASRILTAFYQELRELDGLTLNPALIAGGTEVALDSTHGTVTGKTNITAQRTLIRGDLRTLSAEQLQIAQEKMRAIVARHLPRTSATITFSEGYPAMAETPANHALLTQLDQASRDLGFGGITAYDPKARGAGDIAFVSPPLPGLDGLGLRGGGAHAPDEWGDLATAPELVQRTALLIYRLTR